MTAGRSLRDNGFTLLELLVVVAVLGLMVILLTDSLRAASSAWHKIARHDADDRQLALGTALLSHLLSQAYPARTGDVLHPSVRFDGRSDGIAFLAPLPRALGYGDIGVYTMQLTNAGTLRLDWRLDRSARAAVAAVVPGGSELMTNDIVNCSFSYYGVMDNDGDARWHSTWRGQTSLPSLIRLRWTWHGRPEDVLVAPLITAAFCQPGGLEAACLD